MKEDRQQILALIDEAVTAGARLGKACQVVGISERTIQRWRKQTDGGEDQREGPAAAPSNKLDQETRQRVIKIANSPEFRDLSPKQIVAHLADRGVYIASESSFYRILR